MKLYVHIPYCIKKCNYCNFISFPICKKIESEKELQFDEYLSAIEREISFKCQKYSGEEVTSIYFGGGTPTLFGIKRLSYLLTLLKEKFSVNSDAEISIEGNPSSFDFEFLASLKQSGFNRFSVGVQSFDDKELLALGRTHNDYAAASALNCISKVFKNFSLDIMLGIPFQSQSSLNKSLEKALSFSPKHISCYMLKIEQGTPFHDLFSEKKLPEISEDELADLYEFTVNYLEEKGYERYETSNFALKGYQSNHNLGYWRCENYLGFGISAHSLYNDRRFYNTDSYELYVKTPENELLEEILTEKDRIFEYLMLGLRLKEGIVFKDFKKRFGCDLLTYFSEQIKNTANFLHITQTSLCIKKEYFCVANEIIMRFM